MKKELVTINLKKMNILAIILFIVPLMLALVMKFVLFKNWSLGFGLWDYLVVILAYPILMILHEGTHALAFIMTGAPKKSVRFGVIPKKMMIYCTTNQPMSSFSYKFALLLPTIILGVIPLIVATITLDWKYCILFATMISGGAGDVMMFIKLLKIKPKMVQDHPKAPAFYALYNENELPPDFKEVTEEDEIKLVETLNSK